MLANPLWQKMRQINNAQARANENAALMQIGAAFFRFVVASGFYAAHNQK